jgi:restriction-modification system family protein
VPELAGRLYVPKLYAVRPDRAAAVDVLRRGIEAGGARVISCTFPDACVAPMYIGAEDQQGRRYGLLVYPFTTTRRETRNRPKGERRTQIRFGDPVRGRDEVNLIARDCAGVDVTLLLAVDPESEFIVGLDPLIYEDLPMGISVYYSDQHVERAATDDWAVWERKKVGGKRRPSWEGLETVVGFRPRRLLDYARFEARASALGLSPDLRQRLAEEFQHEPDGPHHLETFFGVSAETIMDIIDVNFRLGIAVRGGVAEHHLGRELESDPITHAVKPIDEDAQPDFRVLLADDRQLLIECKTASKDRYVNGDFKVEIQKTRDSGSGRKYTYDQFDIIAACLFSATGNWEFRYRWVKDLESWDKDPNRIRAVHRVDNSWTTSLSELLAGD